MPAHQKFKRDQKQLDSFREGMKENLVPGWSFNYYCKDIINIIFESLRESGYQNHKVMEELSNVFLRFDYLLIISMKRSTG